MRTDPEDQTQALVEYIYQLSPEVRAEVTYVTYEDEYAHVKVYSPLSWDEDQCLQLEHQIAQRGVDILIDSGYLILAYVYTTEQQIELAQCERAEAKRRWQEADQVLTQAATLGLLAEPALPG